MFLLNKAKICVFGLGYVGLPLAMEFSKKYPTVGFDNNKSRINDLISGIDNTLEVSNEELKKSSLKYSLHLDDIVDCNIYIVTVPTPIDKNKNPDLLPLESASLSIGKVLRKNDIVIFESTVYPGATENFCVPILEKESGLNYNQDFFCGYSPERINPGDKEHTLTSIIKITSGSTKDSANFIDKLYQSIIKVGTYKASSIAIAESAKVIENVQRDVNIALINEFAMIFNKLDLDTEEILSAANTKWNFLPFKPGLVGGHCIGVDPYYLTHRAKEIGYYPEIILAGRRINDGMGKYVSNITVELMTKMGISSVGAKVAILGLTFKENCPDMRNTKVLSIINNLINYNCDVIVTDPYADKIELKEKFNIEIQTLESLQGLDAVILAVAHSDYLNINLSNWEKYFKSKGILIDIKSVYNNNFFNKSTISHWRL